MADEADRADAFIDQWHKDCIDQIRKPIPPGSPGECDLCMEWSGRLIKGACAPCRDKYRLD